MKDENAFVNGFSDRRFGLEIEVEFDRYEDRDRAIDDLARFVRIEDDHDDYLETGRNNDYYHIKHDGSLGSDAAIEVSTPPYRAVDNDLDELRRVLEALGGNGGYITRQCGLHLHQDAQNLPDRAFIMLHTFYFQQQKNLNWFFPPSRRVDDENYNDYCRGLKRIVLDNVARMKSGILETTRHGVVNFSSYSLRGTIEFRQHSGSLKYDKILAWAAFTNSLMEWAERTEDNPIDWQPTDCYYGPLIDVGWFKSGISTLLTNARDFYLRRLQRFIPDIVFEGIPNDVRASLADNNPIPPTNYTEWVSTGTGLYPASEAV